MNAHLRTVKVNHKAFLGRFHARPLHFPMQDTDLVPSDIAAGLALLHQQQDSISSNQELEEVTSHSSGHSQVSPDFSWIVQFGCTCVDLQKRQLTKRDLSSTWVRISLWPCGTCVR